MTILLDVRDLSVNIADKTLLSTLTFQIKQGEHLCVLGPNGAGKSTLLKALLGIIKPSSGCTTINKQAISQLSQKQLAQQISYAPQAYGQTLNFIVIDFIKMSRYAYHSALSDWSADDQTALEKAIEITKIEPFLTRQMNTLSGGEQQRIMIAASICQQATLLLLDEPTSFLDPHHQTEMHQLIRQLNQQYAMSIIEVSHDLNHAVQHSSAILALKQGKKMWFGKASEFFQTKYIHQLYEQQFVFATHPETGIKVALASESQ